jgi:SHS2 domain-containing protein
MSVARGGREVGYAVVDPARRRRRHGSGRSIFPMVKPLTSLDRGPAGHELVDHTSEVTLRLWAATFEDLVAEATRAFADLVPAGLARADDSPAREFSVVARDRAAALVEWLNETVYLCEVERWIPVDVEVEADENHTLRIRARGVRLEEPFVLVKAATLHNAAVREADGRLEAEVTLDV